MRILFVHKNFPGQYLRLVQHLKAEGGHELVAITRHDNRQAELIRTFRYEIDDRGLAQVPPLARHYARAVQRGEAVAQIAMQLRRADFQPDVILGHTGWGETLFLKEVWPRVPLQAYSEFYYQTNGADLGSDPEFQDDDLPGRAMGHSKNAALLLGLATADRGLSPTEWQRDVHPPELRSRIDVVHDGVDTDLARPDPNAFIHLERQKLTFRPGDEVLTFVNRNLEPYRGYHIFMRALPAILSARPKAHAVITGGSEVSYGRAAPAGKTWKQIFLDEVRDRLDLERVHFVGKVPHSVFLNVMQVSAAHVYLTYPFVLSWSMLEAMAAECLVIGSDTPPVREVIQADRNGVLVDFFDVEALAARVIDALANPDSYREIRRQARETILTRYDLKRHCLPRQLALIEALVSSRG